MRPEIKKTSGGDERLILRSRFFNKIALEKVKKKIFFALILFFFSRIYWPHKPGQQLSSDSA